ncbi:MAG: mechanosensitive ion channel domain-containing protein, partial [Myxococcota bacterium]
MSSTSDLFESLASILDSEPLGTIIRLAGVGTLAIIAFFVAKRGVLRLVEYSVKRTAVGWDDVIFRRGVFNALAWLAPALVVYYFAYAFTSTTQGILQRLLLTYMQLLLILVVFRFLDAAMDIYNRTRHAKEIPIKGYVQVIKLLIILIGGIIVFATLLHRSPWGLLSGLGAVTAILLLVFRDTILSFVASIQLTTNNMIRIGDWISFPKYDADGDVIDIALHTVKVQNWDKTITTIPTHRFIEDAFKNWRGMQQSGGRRIKRALHIDMTTIRFLDDELRDRLRKVPLLAEFFEQAANDETAQQEAAFGPGRLTNIGVFRAYVTQYLRTHSGIHQDQMTFLVRQLAPSAEGIGIEIYVFSKEQRWVHYEAIQA